MPNGDVNKIMSSSYFPENFQSKLFHRFIVFCEKLAHPADKTRIFLSKKAYAEAFIEADFDAIFLEKRRGLPAGLSEGKLAGILFYRFSRHRIIHLSHEIIDHPDYENFQEKVVISIMWALMHINLNDPWIRQKEGSRRPGGMRGRFLGIQDELIYLTSKRHYNQESLALFFDTCAYLSFAVDEIHSLTQDQE
jgi:hypothetical protein